MLILLLNILLGNLHHSSIEGLKSMKCAVVSLMTVSKNSISKANCFLKFCLSETSKEATIVNFTFRNGPEFSAQTIMRKAGLTNNRFILAFDNKKVI